MKTTENNKAAKRAYIAALNAGDVDAIDDLFAPEYVLHPAGMADIVGRDTLKGMVIDSLSTLTEVAFAIEDMVAEGDKVATRWRLSAVHSGAFMGIPATRRRFHVAGLIIDRFVDGKVVEGWENFDTHGLLDQLS